MIYTVTTGEYEDEYTVAAFESESEANEFCEITDGRGFKVPLSPSRDSWIMYETVISGNVRDGEYFPYSINTYVMRDPFKLEEDYDKYLNYRIGWGYKATGKTEEESRIKCEGVMRKITGFNGDLEKAMKDGQERMNARKFREYINNHGQLVTSATGSAYSLIINHETGVIKKS